MYMYRFFHNENKSTLIVKNVKLTRNCLSRVSFRRAHFGGAPDAERSRGFDFTQLTS